MKNSDCKFWSKVSHEIMKEVHESITPLVGQKKAGESEPGGDRGEQPGHECLLGPRGPGGRERRQRFHHRGNRNGERAVCLGHP